MSISAKLIPKDLVYLPATYCWQRREMLYIGSADKVGVRLFGHSVIGVLEPLAGTELVIWPMISSAAAIVLERALIFRFRPKYNKQVLSSPWTEPPKYSRVIKLDAFQTKCQWCHKYFTESEFSHFCSTDCFDHMCWGRAVAKLL